MDINTKVAEYIANAGDEIASRVISLMAEKEKERRVNALVQAISELDSMDKDLAKFKPDLVVLNDEGETISANWSKAKFEERKNKLEKRAKLEKSINKALDKNDYSDLFNKQKNDNSKPSEE